MAAFCSILTSVSRSPFIEITVLKHLRFITVVCLFSLFGNGHETHAPLVEYLK